MKIYFVDGYINEDIKNMVDVECGKDNYITLCEGQGYSSTENFINKIYYEWEVENLLTNCIIALSTNYCWNEELNIPEIYLWRHNIKQFVRIDMLTEKELRRAHNIEKLYRTRVFDDDE